ncbi:hypothetical protein RN001_006822 [Aquatica leii]|uniref:RNA helicase n=1 Tax=Aquatica leii TaxID=1421715 RepID=A0AAN7QLD7_9COLE|nr:hypothetical protein RN001_006822 [Aquatica leii]
MSTDEDKCDLCNATLYPGHERSLLHRFNFSLFEWKNYRRALVKNRHGVEVAVKLCDVINGYNLRHIHHANIGCYETKLTIIEANLQLNVVSYLFTVTNNQTNAVTMVAAKLLHPYPCFKLVDFEGSFGQGVALELLPRASYSFKVTFQLEAVSVGTYSMPVAIDLKADRNDFTIAREMLITIADEDFTFSNQSPVKSPFTSAIWKDVTNWYQATVNVFSNYLYPLPKKYWKLIKMGLDTYETITSEEIIRLQELRSLIEPGYVTKDNYNDFFHIALWCDEMGAELMLQRYNMEQVTMKLLPNNILELDVPGLAEKRPSLVNGDIVNIRLHNDHTAYKGVIRTVNNLNIWIAGVDSELLEIISPDTELDVSFQLGRLPLERMHAGVDQCVSKGLLSYFFPDESLGSRRMTVDRIPNYEFINTNVCNNTEQRIAVENIVQTKSCVAPYIVFGPPGTGKTITIVEAILQIIRRRDNAVILVCAPANAACDMLAIKLIEHGLKQSELIRVHSTTRDWKKHSNYIEDTYINPDGRDLMRYRVVVTTLILSGRYVNKGFNPNVLFIDEAAQALEPEACVAISLIKPGIQLILAGDPKQLGPQCDSAVAERLGLNVSLLERLMKLPLYTQNNSNFITTLKLNFRSHPVVLQLPNELFYDGQLRAMSHIARNDVIATVFIYDKIFPRRRKGKVFGQPVEFCAVYFNVKEVEMVLKYVKALINLSETKVVPMDIGVVTPYIRQVYRIKEVLTQNGFGEIEVGTTEVFQGREKRIIIISTVRAQHNLLLYDRKYKLGFVKNEKRFNVALTRAMSKLIIIGCPNVLRFDKNWLKYIEFCEQRYGYFGAKQDSRSDAVKQEVLDRLSNIKRDRQYVRNYN